MNRFLLPTALMTTLVAGSICNAQATETLYARAVPDVNGWNYESRAVGLASDSGACWQGRTSTCSANCPTGVQGSNVYLWATEFDNYSVPSCSRITRVKISARAGFGPDNSSTASGQIQVRVRGPFGEAALPVLDISGNQTWRGPNSGGWDITALLGREWTAADINALEIGIQRESRSAPATFLWADGYRIQIETVVDRPINDECTGAVAVGTGTIGFTTRCSTTGTTGQVGHANPDLNEYEGVLNDLWYSWTAPENSLLTLTARSAASNPNGVFNTGLYTACGAALQQPVFLYGEDGDPTYRVTAGTRYLVQVGNWPGRPGSAAGTAGAGTLRLSAAGIAGNAVCNGALPLTDNAPTAFSSAVAGGYPGQGAWFTWTPTFSGHAALVVESAAATHPSGSVRLGGSCDAGAVVASSAGSFQSNGKSVALTSFFGVVAGQSYSVYVQAFDGDGYFGIAGSLRMATFPFPANDGSAGAVTVSGHGPHAFDATFASTGGEGQTACGSSRGVGNDLWYRWVAPQSGPVYVGTSGLCNGQDTVLQVFGFGGSLACNDNIGGNLESGLQFNASAGATYTIQVGSYVGANMQASRISGAFEILYRCSLADIVGGGPGNRYADGVVDGSDFIAFVNAFAIGDAGIDSLADVTGGGDGLAPDGVVDGSDFVAFINAFAAGC